MTSPELRRDPVSGRWVIIAPGRSNRPRDTPHAVEEEATGDCPFCPGHEAQTSAEILSIRDAAGKGAWRKRVFRSHSPVVSPDEELVRQGEGMFDMMGGYGEHEVIVDAPEHEASLATMSEDDLAELIRLWRDRFLALKKDDRFRYLTLCGNRGAASGAMISHSHSQIIATPILPRRVAEEVSRCYSYFRSKERCVFCDICESEMHEAEAGTDRVVLQNDAFLVLAPFASRFAYETWIMPKDHASHFEEIPEDEIPLLSNALHRSFAALRGAIGDQPYSYVLHTAPTHERGMVHYHWHFELLPRLTNVAGFEWGTGFYINIMPPEEAARQLREYA